MDFWRFLTIVIGIIFASGTLITITAITGSVAWLIALVALGVIFIPKSIRHAITDLIQALADSIRKKGAAPYLETLERLERRLSQADREKIKAELPSGTVTILFSDIEGFTSYVERGDDYAYEIVQTHRQIIREQLKRHGGTEIKTYGDGFMVAFPSARKAVLCAADIQDAFARYNETHKDKILVRIGINSGEPIKEGEDFIGRTVNLASRIVEQARGGQIYVSDVVKNLAGEIKGLQYIDKGQHALKGFSEKQRLYEVARIEALAYPLDSEVEQRLEKLEKKLKGSA